MPQHQKIDATTVVYGIIGHPVAHSLSPAMHNAAFEAMQINAVYLAFDVTDIDSAVGGIRSLGIKGLSVTIPHKVTVMGLIDEVDPVATQIGAVNTIVNRQGHLYGANTDWIGAVKALEEQTKLAGKKVLVIGAGGSSRAVCTGLVHQGSQVHIANRTEEKAERIAQALGCSWSGLDNLQDIQAQILINTTSVGMEPDIDKLPVPEDILERYDIVMDIVYAPIDTMLLQKARAAGCKTINGLRMLLLQAVAQFEMWTGSQAPMEVMEHVLSQKMAHTP